MACFVSNMRNPIFLPKSLFDSYIVKSSGGEVTVDRIQTLGGAERQVRKLAKKYPCVGFDILSEKHNSVIKSYAPAVGKAPKVTEDNSREYKQAATREAKEEVQYTLYIDGQEYASYDTHAEAAAVGRKEGKGSHVKIKQTHTNPLTGVPSHDIPIELRHGKSYRQAVAIGMREQRIASGVENPFTIFATKREAVSFASRIPGSSVIPGVGGGFIVRYPVRVGRNPSEHVDGLYYLNERYGDWYPMQKTPQGTLKFLNGAATRTVDGTRDDALALINEIKSGKYPWMLERKRGKKNPSDEDAAALYESFHGEPSDETIEVYTEEFERVDLATLGDLVQIIVETTTGKLGELNAPEASGVEGVKLASSPDGKQLYFVGGDQSIPYEAYGFTDKDVRDHMVIGIVREITYHTRKGFDNFEPTDYYHHLGEETKAVKISDEFRRKPTLIYNPNDQTMKLAGGLYEVREVGIVN